jgi:transcriptional regulator with XRE-family HTH domain
MKKKSMLLRKVLSQNIKNQRELLCFTQEKLAEKAQISSNMLRDIEGCRTWVSDTTLVNIAAALKTDIYRLFMPYPVSDDENYKTVYLDLIKTFDKLQTDFSSTLEKTLKLWKK